MTILLRRLRTREEGQDLLEYGILVSLIAIVALAAMNNVADQIIDVFWGQIVGLDLF
jgi:Flp pilus assembly pilin Flp